MNVEEYTPKDWAKDFYLTDEILKCLNSTDSSDFVYTILYKLMVTIQKNKY